MKQYLFTIFFIITISAFYLFNQLFIYLILFIFILCIYFLTFIFYINWCQSPVTCFFSSSFLPQLFPLCPGQCERCGDGGSVYGCLLCVGGGWCICLRGWEFVLNWWVWSVCSKISFIGKSFLVIEVLFLSFIWV